MGLKEKLEYDIMETGIKLFGGYPSYLEVAYKASVYNHAHRIPSELRITIPSFKQVLQYLLDNRYIGREGREGRTKFIVTEKGESYLKELKTILFSEEQIKIARNQVKIAKEQARFNKILAWATLIVAFGVIYDLLIKPNANNPSTETKIFLGLVAFFGFLVPIVLLFMEVCRVLKKEK